MFGRNIDVDRKIALLLTGKDALNLSISNKYFFDKIFNTTYFSNKMNKKATKIDYSLEVYDKLLKKCSSHSSFFPRYLSTCSLETFKQFKVSRLWINYVKFIHNLEILKWIQESLMDRHKYEIVKQAIVTGRLAILKHFYPDMKNMNLAGTISICEHVKVLKYLNLTPDQLFRNFCNLHYNIHNNPELYQYLVDRIDKNRALVWCCENNLLVSVKDLVGRGADINTTNSAPLRYACLIGSEDIVKYLIRLGAKITKECRKNALERDHTDILEILDNNLKKNNN